MTDEERNLILLSEIRSFCYDRPLGPTWIPHRQQIYALFGGKTADRLPLDACGIRRVRFEISQRDAYFTLVKSCSQVGPNGRREKTS